jgi:hypothetical protein
MPPRFFELSDDVSVPHRWHLQGPRDSQGRELEDPVQFNRGRPVKAGSGFRIALEQAGMPLDFSEAGLKVPVVHVKVASVFTQLAPRDVQLLPTAVEGQPDQYLILVATKLIRCIDEQASRVRLWTHADGVPHKVGQYRDVRDLRIDKARVGDAKVFRPEGWTGTLVVSEDLKVALEQLRATGLKFEEV